MTYIVFNLSSRWEYMNSYFNNSKYAHQDLLNFIGHANSVPDGSSPRGYNQGLVLGCRLHALCRHIFFFLPEFYNISGARTALPMGVAPEAMNKYLYLIIDSRHFYFVFPYLFSFFQSSPRAFDQKLVFDQRLNIIFPCRLL